MSNAVGSRMGDINNGGSDPLQLFLKIFANEVLLTFEDNVVAKDKIMVKRIAHGKSAQFPVIGDAAATFHVAGQDVFLSGNGYATQFLHNERIINVDNPLVSAVFIPEIDELMNHYQARAHYAKKLAYALAKQWDTYALRVGVLAARAAATLTGGKAGVVITDADANSNGLSLIESIVLAAQNLDVNNVPKEDRFAFVRPEQHYKLLLDATNNPALINLDKNVGGEGSFATGVVGTIAGIRIVPTNLLPSTNVASPVTGANNTYHGNFSTTQALVMQKDAIGAVMLKDVTVQGEYDMDRLGHKMIAHLVSGIGILRPECAVEIKTS